MCSPCTLTFVGGDAGVVPVPVDGVPAGWAGHSGQGRVGTGGRGDIKFGTPIALACVPGLGLVVRQPRQLQFFAAPDLLAMSFMSAARVIWMVAVARGAAHRAMDHGLGQRR